MKKSNEKTLEIDILYLVQKLWVRKFLIIFVSVLFGTMALAASVFLIDTKYTAVTRIYVVNQNNSNNITAQDLQAGTYLVSDYKEIITSREVMTDVIVKNKLKMTPESLGGMVSVSIPTDTRVISISVTSENPKESAKLANSVRQSAAEKIKNVTKVQDVTTLEKAEKPSSPSSPNIKRNTLLGIVFGGAVAIACIILSEILDDRVKRPEDIEETLGMTLIGVVPDTNKM